jgi:PAS domain S-box-containing protein
MDEVTASKGVRSRGAKKASKRDVQLEKEKREYASIIRELPLGVVGLDYDGRCVFINRSARTFLGVGDDHAEGRGLFDLVDDRGLRSLLREAIEMSRDGYPTARTVDFGGRTLEVRSSIPAEIDRISSVVLTVEDVTWRKRAEKQKDEFLGLVSHELRTPLTVIKGYLDIFERGMMGMLTSQQTESTHVMLEQCNNLERLIKDLIRFRSLTRGPDSVCRELVALKPFLSQLAGDFDVLIKDAGMTLTLDVDDDNLLCWCDAKQLRDVLYHVIDNGVKFANEGKTLSLSAKKLERHDLPPINQRVIQREPEPHTRWVRISVADRGPGIAEDRINLLFNSFEQGEEHLTRKAHGLGIGLSVVKRVVDINGGTLWVDSEVDRGTNLFFTLPLVQPKTR